MIEVYSLYRYINNLKGVIMSKIKSLVPEDVNAFDELDYSGENDGATIGV
jgi:hypothetical protein